MLYFENRGWVTINGKHINIPSPKGANSLNNKGFSNKQKLNNHWKNGRTHQEEYAADGIFTAEQYEQRAVELAESAADDVNVFGHLDKNGFIVRYDINKNDFVKADVNKGVFTLFKPVEGFVYYENQKRGDIKNGGRE